MLLMQYFLTHRLSNWLRSRRVKQRRKTSLLDYMSLRSTFLISWSSCASVRPILKSSTPWVFLTNLMLKTLTRTSSQNTPSKGYWVRTSISKEILIRNAIPMVFTNTGISFTTKSAVLIRWRSRTLHLMTRKMKILMMTQMIPIVMR